MTVNDIAEKLNMLYPLKYAEQWDNSGLLIGFGQREVHKVLITLEVDVKTADYAVEQGVDMIISHHPLIFSGMKQILDSDCVGKRVIKLIQNNISLYVMHTNYDALYMARDAAKRVGILEGEVLVNEQDDYGIGIVGELEETVSVKELCEKLKTVFELEHVGVYGELDAKVSRAAIVPGSGKEFYTDAISHNAQVLITGDVSHHFGVDAIASDFTVIDAGHFGLEHIFIETVAEKLGKELTGVNVIKNCQANPLQFI